MLILTDKAKAQRRPGYDTWRRPHIMYVDDINRDWAVASLYREAFKAFTDSISLQRRGELALENLAYQQWSSGGDIHVPCPPATGDARTFGICEL